MYRWRMRSICGAAVLAAVLLMNGCSGDSDNRTDRTPHNIERHSSGTSGMSGLSSGITYTAAADADVHDGIGTFIGWNGSRSVQLETPGGPMTFWVADGIARTVSGLRRNDRIHFKFTEHSVEGDRASLIRVMVGLTHTGPDADGPDAAVPTAEDGRELALGLLLSKELPIEFDGREQMADASLVAGEGFALYVFEPFLFNRADNRLSLKRDPDHYAYIIKLSDGYRLDELQQEGEAWLRSLGDVQVQQGGFDGLHGVTLCLTASGDAVTQHYIVKEASDGTGYVFKLNLPHRESAADFVPFVYDSLDSIISVVR